MGSSFLTLLLCTFLTRLSLKLPKPVLPAAFGGEVFIQMLQSESPSCKHVEADPDWIHQSGSNLQAVSLCLVPEKCLAWLFLLDFISFCSSIHCLDGYAGTAKLLSLL